MASKDKTAESYNVKKKKHQDFDISTPPGTPGAPRGTAGAAILAANAPAPAALAAAQSPAGQPAQSPAGATGLEFRRATCSYLGDASGVPRALGQ
eukprot:4329756-Pyramimonas_sp.AAC.1